MISGGHLYRGSQGCAGEVGRTAARIDTTVVCRCGNIGCLEALAGSAALARDGEAAAKDDGSPILVDRLAANGTVSAEDVAWAARNGDRAAFELIQRAGRLIGDQRAMLVSFFNPSLLLIGGGVADAGDHVLDHDPRGDLRPLPLPLATRDLRIVRSSLGDRAGVGVRRSWCWTSYSPGPGRRAGSTRAAPRNCRSRSAADAANGSGPGPLEREPGPLTARRDVRRC